MAKAHYNVTSGEKPKNVAAPNATCHRHNHIGEQSQSAFLYNLCESACCWASDAARLRASEHITPSDRYRNYVRRRRGWICAAHRAGGLPSAIIIITGRRRERRAKIKPSDSRHSQAKSKMMKLGDNVATAHELKVASEEKWLCR